MGCRIVSEACCNGFVTFRAATNANQGRFGIWLPLTFYSRKEELVLKLTMAGLPLIAAIAVILAIALSGAGSQISDVYAQVTDTPTPTVTASDTPTPTASATATPTSTAGSPTATTTTSATPVQPAAVPVTGGEPGSGSSGLVLAFALGLGAIAIMGGLLAASHVLTRRS